MVVGIVVFTLGEGEEAPIFNSDIPRVKNRTSGAGGIACDRVEYIRRTVAAGKRSARRHCISRGSRMARILVVDDDVDTLKLAAMILQRAGHNVVSVEKGMDALTEVGKEKPDIVLLDIMLPDMDGFSVAQKLRTSIQHPPPILFFSARSTPEDQIIGRTLGDGYLLKPVRLTTLLESVQKVLDANAANSEKK
jgi:CheY-like chemotaxis protein